REATHGCWPASRRHRLAARRRTPGNATVTASVTPAMQLFVTALDFIGTFVFALSGAVAAAKRGLDVFGVLVLSIVAANTGGIICDVVIRAIPLAGLGD